MYKVVQIPSYMATTQEIEKLINDNIALGYFLTHVNESYLFFMKPQN